MSDEAVSGQAEAPEDEGHSIWALMARALIRPSRAFEWMRERPRWVWPFIVILAAGTIFALTAAGTPAGREAQLQSLEAQREQLGEEMYQQALEQINSPLFRTAGVVIAVIGSLVGGAAAFFLTAIVYHGFIALLGGRESADYRTALAVAGFSFLPGAIRSLLQTGAVLFGGVLPAEGLSGILPRDQILTPMGAFLSRIDLFVIWGLIIAAVGLATLFKVSRAKAWGVVLGWWALGTLAMMGLALLSGRFMPG